MLAYHREYRLEVWDGMHSWEHHVFDKNGSEVTSGFTSRKQSTFKELLAKLKEIVNKLEEPA
jgi:hypothetical protein